jgi:hypothetical protein
MYKSVSAIQQNNWCKMSSGVEDVSLKAQITGIITSEMEQSLTALPKLLHFYLDMVQWPLHSVCKLLKNKFSCV